MIITITPDGFIASGEQPEIGHSYELEDVSTGTGAQNRAFHALIQEYWRSGAHSYNVCTFDEFRDCIKRDLGAGFESFVYAHIEDGQPRIGYCKTFEDVPEYIRHDPELRSMVRGRLKSWSDYSKKERKESLDRLIAEMQQAGVNSKKFNEILEGMGAYCGA